MRKTKFENLVILSPAYIWQLDFFIFSIVKSRLLGVCMRHYRESGLNFNISVKIIKSMVLQQKILNLVRASLENIGIAMQSVVKLDFLLKKAPSCIWHTKFNPR